MLLQKYSTFLEFFMLFSWVIFICKIYIIWFLYYFETLCDKSFFARSRHHLLTMQLYVDLVFCFKLSHFYDFSILTINSNTALFRRYLFISLVIVQVSASYIIVLKSKQIHIGSLITLFPVLLPGSGMACIKRKGHKMVLWQEINFTSKPPKIEAIWKL